jgi:hypothetical protein
MSAPVGLPTDTSTLVSSTITAAPQPHGTPNDPLIAQRRVLAAHSILWIGLVITAAAYPLAIAGFRELPPSRVQFELMAFVVFIVAAFVAPSSLIRRAVAIGLVIVTMLWLGVFSNPSLVHARPLGFAGVLAAWLILRQRRGLAHFLAVPAAGFCFAFGELVRPSNTVPQALAPFVLVGLCGLVAATLPAPKAREVGDVLMVDGTTAVRAYGAAPQNTLAVVAFVLSFFAAIPAVICGHVALVQIRRTHERGRGLAIAALVIGYLGLAISIVFILIAFGLSR